MSKNNVWRELMERLKQKAEAYEDIAWKFPLVFEGWKRKEKWVRLEDVLSILERLKQNYVLVSKEKLEEIYKNLEIDKISGYYVNLEFFRMIEELLKR
ncbi:hypothetical protein DRO54_05155 [Candidatus Bathyarchaeota archaeon]|nr:MAG: hypothetical protein DRO54_05155 [Candidatus Bathyarchaeota archaeon]